MGKRKIQVIILCEDRQQEVFARHFLIKKSCFKPGEIRVLPLPDGKQSGEQYVRETYPKQVKLYRSQSTYRSVCLIVLTDADPKYSVKQRLDSLDSALEENEEYSQPKRQPQEKIAIFVPKRNIETWICYLRGETVDEETKYPKLAKPGDCKNDVDILLDWCNSNAGLPEDAPPSLQAACGELQRIFN
ncbi:MAG: hypothetical protein SXA11_08785 [Cyanobacteriota bacterium]|nr:hypothetical protein [Cyanobacteriota bacterium]